MRRVVEINAEGTCLVGTAHGADAGGARCDTALLLLNAGALPRAWNYGLPVRLADAAARRGVPAFRFDLPGLGDSPGEMPEWVEEFRRASMDGRDDRVITALASQLRARFNIQRLVLGGLCLGATSSVRAAALTPDGIAGLILFEPDVRGPLPIPGVPAGPTHVVTPSRGGPVAWLSKRFGRASIEQAAWLGPLRRPLIHTVRHVAGGRVPDGTHAGVVAAWRTTVGLDIPILMVMAERGLGWFATRLLESLPRRAVARNITFHTIAGTDHAFLSGQGPVEALRLADEWVARHFAPEPARGTVPLPLPTGTPIASVPQ